MSGKEARKNSKRVKLICNPEAGDPLDPTGRIEQVTRMLMQQGFEVSVALAKPKEKAYKIAKKAVDKGYRTIIAMGGDGTVESVARALVNTKARLAILPGGTENNIIAGLGIPTDLEGACRLLEEGQTRKIDVGQVKTKNGKKLYFFELVGVGLVAALLPHANKLNKGKVRALGKVVNKLVNFQMPKMKLKLDDESVLEVDSLLVTISNFPTFGKKFLVAPEGSLDDGLLDVNLYPKMTKAELGAYFAAIRDGNTTDNTKVERYRVRKITVKGKPKQEVVADSIPLGKGKVTIRIRPRALRVIAGTQPGIAEIAQPDGKANKQEELPAPVAPAPQPAEKTPAN